MAAEPLELQEFSRLLEECCPVINEENDVAVGLSGGPDSLVLAKLLSEWGTARGKHVHALTVDHDLRPESGKEAQDVAAMVKDWSHLTHAVLKWEGEKPASRIQEEARAARYKLIADYCRKHDIRFLVLAHHQNDQMETFLFRLAKGSGLDGLTVMKSCQPHKTGITVLRPFLDITKDRLIETCRVRDLPYIEDPSNVSDNFFRARLRKFMPFLESEGFTAKRMAVTSDRLERARLALDQVAAKLYAEVVCEETPQSISYKYKPLQEWPEEIGLRVLIRAIESLRAESPYLPRREKIETLFNDLNTETVFRKRTLGGLVFERDDGEKTIRISPETLKSPAPDES